MSEKVTPEQITEVLKKNGINSIEDLAKQLADDQNSAPGTLIKDSQIGDEIEKKWIILVWELSKNLDDFDVKNLPDALGGSILNQE